MKLVLVAALDRNYAIGRGNALPWRLPDDLKRFKALTLGKPLLMGRKTALSLGRALPGRRNLVLTRSGHAPFEGMHAVASLDEACRMAAADEADELCVIGGGQVYALCLPLAARMHLTHVDTAVDGADAFFPRFDAARWTVLERQTHTADAHHAHAFAFVEYAPKEVPLGDAPKEVPLGGASKEVPLGDAPKEVPLGGASKEVTLEFVPKEVPLGDAPKQAPYTSD